MAWQLDSLHTQMGFAVKHTMVSDRVELSIQGEVVEQVAVAV
jgi:hypothetical protein